MAKREFTNSELSCYQQCPKKWQFNYIDRLQPIKTKTALQLGDLFHQAMADYYMHNRSSAYSLNKFYEKIIELKKDVVDELRLVEINEMYELGTSMLSRYFDYAAIKDDFEVIEIEKPFIVPILTDKNKKSNKFMYRFKCDMLILRRGKLWIKEFKTAVAINTDYLLNLTLDDQVSRYCLGVSMEPSLFKKYGKVEGVLYTVVKKSIPSIPEILKNGELSKNKAINTTYEIYLNTIKKHGLNESNYTEILEILKQKGNTFVFRDEVLRTQKDLLETKQHLYNLCITIATNPPIWKSPSHDCSWKCSYRNLCIEDSESLRKAEYTIRDAYHAEYAEPKKEEKITAK